MASRIGAEGNGLGEPIKRAKGPGKVHPIAGPGHPLAQVRGVLAERVAVSIPLDPFLSLKALASYSGLSARQLRDYRGELTRPLPHYRLGGKLLVGGSDFDAWMAAYRQHGRADVGRVVADVLTRLS